MQAAANAHRHGVYARARFSVGGWHDDSGFDEPFDLVVSNPPYIASSDINQLAIEVKMHDPLRALDGGADGLDAYRAIVPLARRLLKTGGALLLEIGHDQGTSVPALCRESGFGAVRVVRDLSGHDRVVTATN